MIHKEKRRFFVAFFLCTWYDNFATQIEYVRHLQGIVFTSVKTHSPLRVPCECRRFVWQQMELCVFTMRGFI